VGFTYCEGRLCCDFCDAHGQSAGVRRMRCPYGYCQDWATCADCRKLGKHKVSSNGGRGTHREICRPLSEQSAAEERRRQAEKGLRPAAAHGGRCGC